MIGILLIALVLFVVAGLAVMARLKQSAQLDPEDVKAQHEADLAWLRQEMLDALEKGKPCIIYRSASTQRELNQKLGEMLRRMQRVLPEGTEIIPDQTLSYVPDDPVDESYDGWITVRLHRKTVA